MIGRALTPLRRVWASPRLIPVLSVLTVIALAAAAFAVFGVLAQDDARERDRVATDLAACERGNTLRLQVVALGDADQDMVSGVLDVVLPVGRSPQVDQIRADLEPILARHQARIDDIELVDCSQVTAGAKTPTTEDP